MIGRKLVLGIAALALCLGGASMAHAKACPAKCKTEIKACRQTECAGLRGKAKRQCVHGCKSRFVTVCKQRKIPTACSPSGAFLE
jgi:hypothetical protein